MKDRTRDEIEPPLPSPLEGEGGASAPGEGKINRRHKEWRTALTPVLRGRAKHMRKAATGAEDGLWNVVRNRRFAGFKFRRQVPIGPYIVDVMCPVAMLVVELDGSQHADSASDRARDTWLAEKGYRVLRFWNNDLTDNRDGVLEAIWAALHTSPHPGRFAATPLPQGERGENGRQS